jgi:hypothetical protein
MRLVDAVRLACQHAIRADIGQIDHREWQIIYRRKESAEQFCRLARSLGFDARDEGGGTIVVYDSTDPVQ